MSIALADLTPEQAAQAQEIADELTAARVWPLTLKLYKPVEFGKQETITELVFRDGRAGDLRKLDPPLKVGEHPTEDQLLTIASRMCGQPSKVIDLLSAEDAGEVVSIALGFWLRSQPGGSALSR